MKPRFFIASLVSVFTEKAGIFLIFTVNVSHEISHETSHETAYGTVHEIMGRVRQFGKEIEIIL